MWVGDKQTKMNYPRLRKPLENEDHLLIYIEPIKVLATIEGEEMKMDGYSNISPTFLNDFVIELLKYTTKICSLFVQIK